MYTMHVIGLTKTVNLIMGNYKYKVQHILRRQLVILRISLAYESISLRNEIYLGLHIPKMKLMPWTIN